MLVATPVARGVHRQLGKWWRDHLLFTRRPLPLLCAWIVLTLSLVHLSHLLQNQFRH